MDRRNVHEDQKMNRNRNRSKKQQNQYRPLPAFSQIDQDALDIYCTKEKAESRMKTMRNYRNLQIVNYSITI